MKRKQMKMMAEQNFSPLFSMEETRQFESSYDAKWGVRRRLTWATLANSRDDMLKNFGASEEKAETLLSLIDEIDAYQKHLVELAKISESAVARLMCVASAIAEKENARCA